MKNDPVSLTRSGGILIPKLIGLREASTFTGFCAYHDDTTFAPIEKHPFAATVEHTFLLGYRVCCRELYGKRMEDEFIPFMKTLDRGLPLEAQAGLQAWISKHAAAANAGLEDAEYHKSLYDSVLTSRDYSNVQYYLIRFADTTDLLCAGGHCPCFDFAGRQLQDHANLQERLDGIAFCLIPTDSGGAAVFSWVGKSRSAEALVKSLDVQSDDQIPHSIVRYVFEFFENSYFSPVWWEGLDEQTRGALQGRFNTMASPFTKRESTCLLDEGIRAVSWRVCSRETSI